MDHLTATTTILRDLIAYPTVSADSNLAMIADLAGRLEDAGARVEVMGDATGTKANLWATLGPDTDGGIVLSGHTDVVPIIDQDWATDPFQMTEIDGALYGRGSCDMKGFIAACVALAPKFGTNRPVHFAFTYDEEVGCLGGQALVETLRQRGRRPAMAIIGEPTNMQIVDGHKGCCEYSTHFTGREGHGSQPDLGVNAVEYAVRYVGRLLTLKDQMVARAPANSPFTPPWTTINTGALNGGVAHNVIPGRARVDWEMRPVRQADADFIRAELALFCTDTLLPKMQVVDPTATIRTQTIGDVAGLDPTDQNAARDLVAALTGGIGTETVPFSTEAGLFQSLGIDVVVCGPGSIAQAHRPDEFVSLDQLSKCVHMLESLATRT